MTRVRLIITVNIKDDVDEQEIIDTIWGSAADVVKIEVLDRVER